MDVNGFTALLQAGLIKITTDPNNTQYIVATQQQFSPTTGQATAPVSTTINYAETQTLITELQSTIADAQTVLAQFLPQTVQASQVLAQPVPA